MSYQMRISPRSRTAGRFIARVHAEIQKAFVASGLKQNDLAKKLGVDRSAVNKQLLGQSNLTLRSIADLAWALDAPISFSIGHDEVAHDVKRNFCDGLSDTRTEDSGELSRLGVKTITPDTAREPEYV
ncbi:helix-turn-helix transcriptional regulator [Mesorhizobium sp. LHD-90]|uniref:helix-turn-helix domain-containing protein n=1 Tax=Mesorhizobium sp. LHD-90 TaxID=3071414 RepID=UPI0027E15A93|nr:helix-turn-helix transcriptional regulator [Mesorhizobium sp. LHD-90]MDQ6435532.1 helix-turn-helix transcriptional regulator [Mesorhizobium sp. LHD-90]